MIIELTLNSSNFLRHNKIVELPEDRVELLFNATAFSVGTLVLTVKSHETEKQYKISPLIPIDVSEHFTTAGEVNAAVSLSVRGNVARTWQIEPFCVRKIPNGFEAIPEIIEMREELETVKKALSELVKIIENN